MADPATYRPKTGEIPHRPGVYRFRDEHGRVIYVGKAKNLRSRLTSYFQDLTALHPRTQRMVTTANSVEWTVVNTEVEALTLEYTWIKEYDPRFNVKYRDDKSYPYLAITMNDVIPRAQVMRGAKKKGNRYFGPYGHAWAIRETLDLLLRVFPVRTCATGVLRRAQQSGRPCLLADIDKCSAPCVGRVNEAEHRQIAEDLADFLAGNTGKFVREVERQMKEAAGELEFEKAARLRDDLAALTKAMEKNSVVFNDSTDADIFALAGDELEAAVQVFHVRGGRIRGQRGWIVEKVEDVSDDELVARLLLQVYGDADDPQQVPRQILVPLLPADAHQLEEWLTGIRSAKVRIRVPQRGDKRTLAETVHANAEQALISHRSKRAGDLTTRSEALRDIEQALGLKDSPLRIECYDVSHTQGTYQSASMVVFEDGLPRKSEYRVFYVRGDDGTGARDDTAAMHEIMTRRFKQSAAAGDQTAGMPITPENQVLQESPQVSGEISAEVAATPERRRFAYPPQLIVVDGGQPQVEAAARAFAELGITDVALCGLAKRLEEIWLPGRSRPVIMSRSSQGLYFLQRLRDEAHRFAIQQHRKRRSKGMTASVLDEVPGIGPQKRANLLKHFGSVKKISAASVDELSEVAGIGRTQAQQIHDHFSAASKAKGMRDTP